MGIIGPVPTVRAASWFLRSLMEDSVDLLKPLQALELKIDDLWEGTLCSPA